MSQKKTAQSIPHLATLEKELHRVGDQCARILLKKGVRLVLVESCTGGLVAATLARTSGISQILAGSFVAYQNDSKIKWLGVSAKLLKAAPDGVSPEIAGSLAWQALKRTPHADLCLSVTGRLGPSTQTEEAEQDGYAWIGLALQGEEQNMTRATAISFLPGASSGKSVQSKNQLRQARQLLATRGVLEVLTSLVKSLEQA